MSPEKIEDIFRTRASIDFRANTVGNVMARHILFAVLTVCFVLVLRPDLYGLIPNSLDPIFYTGYAVNLDDALAAAGNGHYFVTRWSSYLPQYVSCQLFGPYWGRLVLRMLLLSVLFEMFWRLGARFRFSVSARIVSSLLVVFSPIFVRAFTTDYQEYTSIFYGLLLVGVVVSQPFEWKRGLAVGALAALMVISNPFSFGLIGISTLVWLGKCLKGMTASRMAGTILASLSAFMVTILVGYLIFRFHYRIGNVYEPTIRFIREFEPPAVDLWTAPGRQWLGHFGWLFIPIMVLLLSRSTFRFIDKESRDTVRALGSIVALTFAFHVYMQLSRGHALETGYYWAMALPPVFLFLFLMFCALIPEKKLLPIGILAGLLIIAVVGEIPQRAQLGSGWNLIVGILVLTSLIHFFIRFAKVLSLGVLVLSLMWIQIGSPAYRVLTYGGDLNSPRYDLVYGQQSNISNDVLRELIWFNTEMDRIDDEWKSTFLSAGGWSAGIVGTYIPHPFSRWITAQSEQRPLSRQIVYELEFGGRKYLTVFGDVNEVAKLIPGVKRQLPRSRVLLDVTHSSALGYRLVVFRGNDVESASAEISLSDLDRTIGTISADGSVTIPANAANGYATFGPYFTLGPGRYRAQITYESSSEGNFGLFEMYNDVSSKTFGSRLVSDGSGTQKADVLFNVTESDGTWQVRTEYFGTIPVKITRIIIERMSQDES